MEANKAAGSFRTTEEQVNPEPLRLQNRVCMSMLISRNDDCSYTDLPENQRDLLLNGAGKPTSSATRGSYLRKRDLLLRSSASLRLAEAVTRTATERRLYLSRLLADCEDEY